MRRNFYKSTKKLLKKKKLKCSQKTNRIFEASLGNKKWFLEFVNDCKKEDSWKGRGKKKYMT